MIVVQFCNNLKSADLNTFNLTNLNAFSLDVFCNDSHCFTHDDCFSLLWNLDLTIENGRDDSCHLLTDSQLRVFQQFTKLLCVLLCLISYNQKQKLEFWNQQIKLLIAHCMRVDDQKIAACCRMDIFCFQPWMIQIITAEISIPLLPTQVYHARNTRFKLEHMRKLCQKVYGFCILNLSCSFHSGCDATDQSIDIIFHCPYYHCSIQICHQFQIEMNGTVDVILTQKNTRVNITDEFLMSVTCTINLCLNTVKNADIIFINALISVEQYHFSNGSHYMRLLEVILEDFIWCSHRFYLLSFLGFCMTYYPKNPK